MSLVTVVADKQLRAAVSISWGGERRLASVPDCVFKECQKLINILELGACQGPARSHQAAALFTLPGKQVRPHEGEFHFKNSI